MIPELDDAHVHALQDLGYSIDQIEKLNLAQHRAILQHKIPAKGHAFVPRQVADRPQDPMDSIVSAILNLPANVRQIAETSPRLLAEFVRAALKENDNVA